MKGFLIKTCWCNVMGIWFCFSQICNHSLGDKDRWPLITTESVIILRQRCFRAHFPPVSLLFGTVSLLQEGDARRHFSALHWVVAMFISSFLQYKYLLEKKKSLQLGRWLHNTSTEPFGNEIKFAASLALHQIGIVQRSLKCPQGMAYPDRFSFYITEEECKTLLALIIAFACSGM